LLNLIVTNRDYSGTVVEQHTSIQDNGIVVTPNHTTPGRSSANLPQLIGTYPGPSNTTIGDPAFGALIQIGSFRTDGYQAGSITIQGVRAYSSDLGSWTTPDAYDGELSDPLSQQAFTWNANNPISNTDSSGYCSTTGAPDSDMPHTEDFGECHYNPPYMINPWGAAENPPGVNAFAGARAQGVVIPAHGCASGDGVTPPLPNGRSWSAEYLAGLQNGLNPVAEYEATAEPSSPFNYQYQGGQEGLTTFRPAGNFGLGVYGTSAGIPIVATDAAIAAIL
jgi:hypothetical protein